MKVRRVVNAIDSDRKLLPVRHGLLSGQPIARANLAAKLGACGVRALLLRMSRVVSVCAIAAATQEEWQGMSGCE